MGHFLLGRACVRVTKNRTMLEKRMPKWKSLTS
uniref:Uncharacterized protein n=1 Tax=Arundo donax TaxID=35708 RepID=A0A0A9C5D3_ARUDO